MSIVIWHFPSELGHKMLVVFTSWTTERLQKRSSAKKCCKSTTLSWVQCNLLSVAELRDSIWNRVDWKERQQLFSLLFALSQSSFFRLRGVSWAVGFLRGAQVDLMYISAGEGLLFNFFWGGHQVFITNPTTNRQCCWSCRHSRSSWSASSGGSVMIAGPSTSRRQSSGVRRFNWGTSDLYMGMGKC